MHRPALFPAKVRSRGDKYNDQGYENSMKVLLRLLAPFAALKAKEIFFFFFLRCTICF